MLKKLSLALLMLICSGFLLLSCSDDSSTEPVINSTLTCKITSPLTNSSFAIGSAVSITAEAADVNSSVKEVAFYINNTVVNRDTIAPYQLNWNTYGLDSINYQIKAVARNSKGETCSNEITVKLVKPTINAVFVTNYFIGNITTSFVYDASGSHDLYDNDSLLQVRWDFDGNGTFDTDWSKIKTATHQFDSPGQYTSMLQVKNSSGVIASCTKSITITNPITTYIQNFDSLTLNQGIVEQNVANWFKWTPTSRDGIISDSMSTTPGQSMRVADSADVLYDFGNKLSGSYKIGFKMFVPSYNVGYFNMLHKYDAINQNDSKYAFEIFLNSNGGKLKLNSSNITFDYTPNSWLDFAIYVNLNNDTAKLTLNGVTIHQWQWSICASGSELLNQLSAIDFYGWTEENTKISRYYIDDFSVMQIE